MEKTHPVKAVPGGPTIWGRAPELLQLESLLDGVLEGRGGLVSLTGEPGIGKTTLARELERRAQSRGISTCWGRSWEEGGAPPLWPWRQVFRSLVRTSPYLQTMPLPESVRALVENEKGGAGSTAVLPDLESQRFAWWLEVSEILNAAAAERPFLLVIEDIHSADFASIALLNFLSQELRSSRLLLVATYRDSDAHRRKELATHFNRLEQDGATLHLSRLGRDAVLAWVRKALGASKPEVEESIVQATLGNPLFVDEVLRLLARRPDASSFPIPHGVRQLLRARLQRLDPSARQLLDSAAVIGTQIDTATLRAVMREQLFTAPQIEQGLQDLEGQDVLVRSGPEHHGFSHALVHEVVVEGLSPTVRAQLHIQIARVLEPRVPAQVQSIANHLLEAAVHGIEDPSLVRWVLKAADHHHQVTAHEDAIALLERARAVVDRRGNPSRLSAELTLALAHAWTRAGNISRARPLCLQIADQARVAADPELLALAALEYGSEFEISLVDQSLVDLLEEARRLLPVSSISIRARVLARLAEALQPAFNPLEPVAMARESIALARSTRDEEVLLAVLHNALAAMMDFARADERLPLNVEQLRLARKRGDKARELRAHMRLLVDYQELGEWDKFSATAKVLENLARALRQNRILPIALLSHSLRACAEGDFERSYQLIAEAEEIYRGTDWVLGRWLNFHKLGLAKTAERRDEVLRLLSLLLEDWGAEPIWDLFFAPMRGILAASYELSEEAAYWLDKTQIAPVLLEDNSGSAILGQLVAAVGSREQRLQMRDRLLPRASYFVTWGLIGNICDGPISRVLALLSVSLEDWSEAERHFADAERLTRTLGMRPLLARILYERARSFEGLSNPKHLSRIRADLDQAQSLAEEVGLPDLITLVQNVRSRLRPRALEKAVPVPADSFQMRLVGEVWTLEFRGKSLSMKDSRGLGLLHRLMEAPKTAIHVLELGSSGTEAGVPDGGDAGPALDARARAQYKERLSELEELIHDAESAGNEPKATRLSDERDRLTEELGRAFGMGNRARRTGSAAERARVAVTRRLRDCIHRIAKHSPEMGRHLDRAVRTGTFCSYDPD